MAPFHTLTFQALKRSRSSKKPGRGGPRPSRDPQGGDGPTRTAAPALIVMARFPRLGKVKTRLEPVLSQDGCLRLYEALLLDTLDRLSSLEAARYLFFSDCTRQEASEFATAHGLPPGWSLDLQEGEDLGRRLRNVCRRLLPVHEAVVCTGADSPTLPPEFVRDAFLLLRSSPVVLGPAEDGGYYLLGLGEAREDLFQGIPWGSERVLAETLSRLAPGEYRLLPRWYDVDTPADLERLHIEAGASHPAPTRTLGFLRNWLNS